MKTKQVAKAAGRDILTFNTWAHRGHFPGITSQPSRMARTYSEDQAVQAVIFSDLEKIAFSTERRTKIAAVGVTRIKIGSITVLIDREDVKRRLRDAATEKPDVVKRDRA